MQPKVPTSVGVDVDVEILYSGCGVQPLGVTPPPADPSDTVSFTPSALGEATVSDPAAFLGATDFVLSQSPTARSATATFTGIPSDPGFTTATIYNPAGTALGTGTVAYTPEDLGPPVVASTLVVTFDWLQDIVQPQHTYSIVFAA